MGELLKLVIHALGYLLTWRAWLGLVLGLVIGFALLTFGVTVIWPGDIILLVGALGLALGLLWAAGVED